MNKIKTFLNNCWPRKGPFGCQWGSVQLVDAIESRADGADGAVRQSSWVQEGGHGWWKWCRRRKAEDSRDQTMWLLDAAAAVGTSVVGTAAVQTAAAAWTGSAVGRQETWEPAGQVAWGSSAHPSTPSSCPAILGLTVGRPCIISVEAAVHLILIFKKTTD